MSKKTYTLKFRCLNCFHKWVAEIPFGQDVVEGMENYHHYGMTGIYCPNCGSSRTNVREN